MFSQQGEGNLANFNIHTSNPYAETSGFKPRWCVNLVTGEMWASTGSIYMGADTSDNVFKVTTSDSTSAIDSKGISCTFLENGQTGGFSVNDAYLRYRGITSDTETGGTKAVEALWIMADGSGTLANNAVSWDSTGDLRVDGNIISKKGSYIELTNTSGDKGVAIRGNSDDSLCFVRVYDDASDRVSNITPGSIGVDSGTLYVEINPTNSDIIKVGQTGSVDRIAIRKNDIVKITESGEVSAFSGGSSSSSSNVQFVSSLPSSPDDNTLYVLV